MWRRATWNVSHISIVMENLFVKRAPESLHPTVSYDNTVSLVHPAIYTNKISRMLTWSVNWSRRNNKYETTRTIRSFYAFISNVFILGKKKHLVRAGSVFSLLPNATWKQSQPVREDVTFVMSTLSVWDRFHVTGDNIENRLMPYQNPQINICTPHTQVK